MGWKKQIPQPKLPRNTVTFDLNGTDQEVLASYRAAQAHFRFWFFCMSEQRVRVANQILYTTPLSGTFYYAVTYRDQYVVFVIEARAYWLLGFYTDKGYFQMLWQEDRLYMDDPQVVLTGFDGNHGRISRAQIEQTKLGVHWVRKGFGGICDYLGPSQRPEPEELRPGLGRFVVMIMESKYKEIFRRCCMSMTRFQHKRLGDEGANHQVHNWNSNCKTVMPRIVEGHASEEEVEHTMFILSELYIFNIDACHLGFFSHTPLPPLPRTDTWEAIDNGSGDPRVRRPDLSARRGRGAVQQPRMSSSMARMRDQQKKSGPRGGAAGGTPDAPSWFTNWYQGDDNEKQCTLVVSGARNMGLNVIEQKPFLKNSPKETQETKSSSSIEDANTTKTFKTQKFIGSIEDGSKSKKSSSNIRNCNNTKNFNTKSSSKDGNSTNICKTKKYSNSMLEDASNTQSSSIRNCNNTKNFNTKKSSNSMLEDSSNTQSSSIRNCNNTKNFNTKKSSNNMLEDASNTQSSSIGNCNNTKNFNTKKSSNSMLKDASNTQSSSIRNCNNTKSSSKDGNSTNICKTKKPSNNMVKDASNTQSSSMVLASDVQELQGPNFLSDTHINRFFRHLSNFVGGGASIQFVDVATTQLIAHCPYLSHEGVDLTSLDIGLFAVNDNENHEVVGGTHWSLLVFDGTQQPPRLVHHDSFGGRNIEAANRLAASLQRLYPGMEEEVVQAWTPQQNNGWDCGVYVMAIARTIMRWWSEGAGGTWVDSWEDRLLTEVDLEQVSQLRANLVRLLMGEIAFQDFV